MTDRGFGWAFDPQKSNHVQYIITYTHLSLVSAATVNRLPPPGSPLDGCRSALFQNPAAPAPRRVHRPELVTFLLHERENKHKTVNTR